MLLSDISSWSIFAAAAGAAALVMWLLTDDVDAQAPMDRELVGRYENRIREMSAPEKVFNYFASAKKNGEPMMTPVDFVRAITPYDFRDSTPVGEGTKIDKQAALNAGIDQVPEVFKLIDADGDGLLNFGEFLFFTVLLAIPVDLFSVAFKLIDENGDGEIDVHEFKRVMSIMRRSTPAGQQQRLHTDAVLNAGLSPVFFGNPVGSKKLHHEEFTQFLRKLHVGILQMEFDRLDPGHTESISARDFAIQLVTYGNQRSNDSYRQRAEELSLDPTRVSFKQYSDFHAVLDYIDDIDRAISLFISSGEPFKPRDLQRAADAVAGVQLDDDTTRIIFHVYDKDGDGRLDYTEFVGALKARASRGTNRPRDMGAWRLVSCVKNCVHEAMPSNR